MRFLLSLAVLVLGVSAGVHAPCGWGRLCQVYGLAVAGVVA